MTVRCINHGFSSKESEITGTYVNHSNRWQTDFTIQKCFLSREAQQSLASVEKIQSKITLIKEYTVTVALVCCLAATFFAMLAVPLLFVFPPIVPIVAAGIIGTFIVGAGLAGLFYFGAKLYLTHKMHKEANKLCQVLKNPLDVSFIQNQTDTILQDRFRAGLNAKDFIFLRKFIAMVDGFRHNPEVQETILTDLKLAVTNDVKDRLVKQGRLAPQAELTQDYRNLVDNFCDDLLLRNKPISQLIVEYKFSRLYFKDDPFVIAEKKRATVLPGSPKDRAMVGIQTMIQRGFLEGQNSFENPEVVRLRDLIPVSKEAIRQSTNVLRTIHDKRSPMALREFSNIAHHKRNITGLRQRIAFIKMESFGNRLAHRKIIL